MLIDAHLHSSGRENTSEVLQALDKAGLDVAFILAPFLDPPFSLSDPGSLRRGNEHLSQLVNQHSDRMVGFAVVNPMHANAVQDLEYAVQDLGLRALKMVPSGWYPYDDAAHKVYEKANQLGIPILFHSGIFIDGRSGRFCRPAFYEALRDHPGLKVTLAHLGWPWCDEANAVGLIDLIHGLSPDDCQFRFDFSFGAPPVYRKEVLHKALEVLGPGLLQFGSDRFLPCSGAHIRSMIDEVRGLLDDLEVDSVSQNRIFSGTAANWMELPATQDVGVSLGIKETSKSHVA